MNTGSSTMMEGKFYHAQLCAFNAAKVKRRSKASAVLLPSVDEFNIFPRSPDFGAFENELDSSRA